MRRIFLLLKVLAYINISITLIIIFRIKNGELNALKKDLIQTEIKIERVMKSYEQICQYLSSMPIQHIDNKTSLEKTINEKNSTQKYIDYHAIIASYKFENSLYDSLISIHKYTSIDTTFTPVDSQKSINIYNVDSMCIYIFYEMDSIMPFNKPYLFQLTDEKGKIQFECNCNLSKKNQMIIPYLIFEGKYSFNFKTNDTTYKYPFECINKNLTYKINANRH